MTSNQIDSAWVSWDNVISIKQFGIKTKQQGKIESTLPTPHPAYQILNGPEQLNIYLWILHTNNLLEKEVL